MRGDVHRLEAPRRRRGHEQAGRRFAVVVQSDRLHLSTTLVAPTSTSARPSAFRPDVEVQGRSTLVLLEATTAVHPGRLGPAVSHLTRDELVAVEAGLQVVLDLEP